MTTQNITPKEALEWLKTGEAILIDVREDDEFQAEHIAYALSTPLSKLDKILLNMDIPAERKIIFQCLKGKRGENACIAYSNLGKHNAPHYNMTGGIAQWKEDGLPTIMKKTGLSIFRQVQIIVGGLVALLVFLGFTGITIGFVIAGILGAALMFAGLTGWCGLAMLLKTMPWNK